MTLFIYCWNLFFFALVALSVQYWFSLPPYPWLTALLLLFMTFWRSKWSKWLLGACIGLVMTSLHAKFYATQINTIFKAAENITIKGTVDSFFKPITHGNEYSFIIEHIDGKSVNYFSQPRVRLIVPEALHLGYGERWQFRVKVKPVYGRRNEAGFDLERYYAASRWSSRVVVEKDSARLLQLSSSIRYAWYLKVQQVIERYEHRGLMNALSFGDRSLMDKRVWNGLRDSGLSHLIAISGLHIGMAFSFAWFFTRIVSSQDSRLVRLPVVAGVIMALGYAWLADFTVTTQRALIMCIALVALEWSTIRIGHWVKLLTVFCLVLLLDPFSAFSNSFWLSFSAVAAVYLVVTNTRIACQPLWIKLITIQCALSLAMLPACALFFNGFSLLAPLYNLIFIPFFSLIIVPLTFVALICSLVSADLSLPVWQLINISLDWVVWSFRFSDGSWVNVPANYQPMILLPAICLLLRPLLSVLQCAVLMVLALCWSLANVEYADWRLDILDVGQGLAILLESQGHYLLYDTGDRWPGGSVAESVIAPVLNQRGVKQLNGLIISHSDSDHAGGRQFIETHFAPQKRLASEYFPGYQVCQRGHKWYWQGLILDMLWPPQAVERAYNEHSCVIRISDGRNSVLLTGDIDKLSEYLLARKSDSLESDIMIVPHHGSDTSSSGVFIRRVSPSLAVASLALGNQWKMPDEQVKRRYAVKDIRWLDTGSAGQISLFFNPDGWRIEKKRENQSVAWYRQMLRKRVE